MDEPLYFAYSATLRIQAPSLDFDLITTELGIHPTYTHRRGDRRSPRARPYINDHWSVGSGLPEQELLHLHIDVLWSMLRPSTDFILRLKASAKVDVFLGYRSNCDHAGFDIPHSSLEMFHVLEVPFGVSVIIA